MNDMNSQDLIDEYNNLPIVRRGIPSSHPKLNFNGKDEIVFDIPTFPGFSGSPILIYNNEKSLYVGNRIYLLAILYSRPQFSINGNIEIVNIPTKQEAVISIKNMMNIGYGIKSHRINDFVPLIIRKIRI